MTPHTLELKKKKKKKKNLLDSHTFIPVSIPLFKAPIKLFFWYSVKLCHYISFNALPVLKLIVALRWIFNLGNKKNLHWVKYGDYRGYCNYTICVLMKTFYLKSIWDWLSQTFSLYYISNSALYTSLFKF